MCLKSCNKTTCAYEVMGNMSVYSLLTVMIGQFKKKERSLIVLCKHLEDFARFSDPEIFPQILQADDAFQMLRIYNLNSNYSSELMGLYYHNEILYEADAEKFAFF